MSIVDRRLNDRNKSLNNRNKYLDRIKDQIKDSVKKAIRSGSVKDLISSKDKKITIPGKGLNKPSFNFKRGGIQDYVVPGNKQFEKGQRIRRPSNDEDQDAGKGGSESGEGEDMFTFSITKQEFLNIFFEDMELPDLIRKQATDIIESAPRRAGYATQGASNKLNIIRSMRQAKGRLFALCEPIQEEIEELEKKLTVLLEDPETNKIQATKKLIDELQQKINSIPFLDESDLRYNLWKKFPTPITQAVMFSVMDVSGSMGEWEKEMAKRFFILLALFLQFNYERVDMIWIRHTSEAREVSEDEFFHARDTGGTKISSALELVLEIINERYSPHKWNIFVSQISDGDNFEEDNEDAMNLYAQIIPKTQYYTYVEINKFPSADSVSSIMTMAKELEQRYEHMKSAYITDVVDIYPVFRQLFEKKA
jgi:uncharacterized sporulation protein YeaH/YhbH (DUF444 family)